MTTRDTSSSSSDPSAPPAAEEPRPDAQQFRKKPVVVQAVQWTGTNADAILGFTLGRASVRDESFKRLSSSERVLVIETLEGSMRAEPGDWIICGVKGEFYPCKPDIFAEIYELVLAGASVPLPASSPQPDPWKELNWYHWNEGARPCRDAACTKSHWCDGHSFDRVRIAVEAQYRAEVQRLTKQIEIRDELLRADRTKLYRAEAEVDRLNAEQGEPAASSPAVEGLIPKWKAEGQRFREDGHPLIGQAFKSCTRELEAAPRRPVSQPQEPRS